MQTYLDKTIICCEETCETPGKEFIVTAGEQEFFAGKGYPIPKRCKPCRENKKNRANSPFKAVADQLNNKGGHRKKDNHRRHGRERMDDFDQGQGN